jgi:hypothetical protein
MNGFGLFTWEESKTYKGEFKNDKKYNFGILICNDGKKYEGFWDRGSQNGLGKFTKIMEGNNESVKIGIYQNNKLITEIQNTEDDYNAKLAQLDSQTEEVMLKVNFIVFSIKNIITKSFGAECYNQISGLK